MHRGVDGASQVLAFCHDDKYLLCGSGDGRLLRWDCQKWRSDSSTNDRAGALRCLACAPDGRTVATAGWDYELFLWSVTSLVRTPLASRGDAVTGLAYSPEGDVLIAGGANGSVDEYDVADRRDMERHGRLRKPITAMTLSPDGRLLAAGHPDGGVTLSDIAKRKIRGELSGHTRIVYAVAFTPDGRSLISGSADGTVRMYDVASRRERQSFRMHKSWVTCIAVAPDGMTAAAGSDDHSVVVWDLDDG
jgi:WD40 repeat protein